MMLPHILSFPSFYFIPLLPFFLFLLLFCLSRVHVLAWACMYCACMWACVWLPEVDIPCHPLLSSLFIGVESLAEPRANQFCLV